MSFEKKKIEYIAGPFPHNSGTGLHNWLYKNSFEKTSPFENDKRIIFDGEFYIEINYNNKYMDIKNMGKFLEDAQHEEILTIEFQPSKDTNEKEVKPNRLIKILKEHGFKEKL